MDTDTRNLITCDDPSCVLCIRAEDPPEDESDSSFPEGYVQGCDCASCAATTAKNGSGQSYDNGDDDYDDNGEPISNSLGGNGSHGSLSANPKWNVSKDINELAAEARLHEHEERPWLAWRFDPSKIAVVQECADFWLLQAIAGKIWMVWGGDNDRWISIIVQDAQKRRREQIARLDYAFRRYCDMAIGGELRHHRAIGGRYISGPGMRHHAWLGWLNIRQEIGPDALIDAAKLFNDFGSNGYGGPKWATACEVLHARETNKISPEIFVDRVFDLAHNGGMFLNKVGWNYPTVQETSTRYHVALYRKREGRSDRLIQNCRASTMREAEDAQEIYMENIKGNYTPEGEYHVTIERKTQTNQVGYTCETIKSTIGPAHHDADTDWRTLMTWATPEVKKLFSEYRDALKVHLRNHGQKALPPITSQRRRERQGN